MPHQIAKVFEFQTWPQFQNDRRPNFKKNRPKITKKSLVEK